MAKNRKRIGYNSCGHDARATTLPLTWLRYSHAEKWHGLPSKTDVAARHTVLKNETDGVALHLLPWRLWQLALWSDDAFAVPAPRLPLETKIHRTGDRCLAQAQPFSKNFLYGTRRR